MLQRMLNKGKVPEDIQECLKQATLPKMSRLLHTFTSIVVYSMLSMFRLKAFAVRTFKVLAPAGILLESRHEVPVRDRKLGPGQVLISFACQTG